MPGNINGFPIVFEAAADAPIAGTLCRSQGGTRRSQIPGERRLLPRPRPVVGNPNNTRLLSQPGAETGGRGDRGDPVLASRSRSQLSRSSRTARMSLKVKATRKEGFDAPITARLLWNPPGIGAPATLKIPKGKAKSTTTINANGGRPDPPIGSLRCMAESGRRAGPDPRLHGAHPAHGRRTLPRHEDRHGRHRAGPRHQRMICKLEQHSSPSAATPPPALTASPKAYHRPTRSPRTRRSCASRSTSPQTPARGKHANLFCQVEITEDGQPIPHKTRPGRRPPRSTRHHRPRNRPPSQKEQQPDACRSKASRSQKPLSRLEQLRQRGANK